MSKSSSKWSPALLKMELNKWLWKDEPHVSLKWVWECLATYLYLSRLSSSDVLLDAVREGIRTREFGYANNVQADGKICWLAIRERSRFNLSWMI